MVTQRKIREYWTEIKRIVRGEVKQPPAEDFWTIDQAENYVSGMREEEELDDQRVTTLEGLANSMAALSEDRRAAAIEKRARKLVAAERQRRDVWIRQRYDELASKRSGDAEPGATPEECAQISGNKTPCRCNCHRKK